MSDTNPSRRWFVPSRRLRRWIVAILVLVVMGVLGFAAYRLRGGQGTGGLPVAPVRKGDFLVIVRCRGELKARRSVQIVAPVNVPELRIVWLASPGGAVKEGDVVIRFDPSSAKQQLQEKESSLRQAQASLDQATAQANITAEQDKIDLATSKYELERARLEVSKQEIVSALQGEESRIDFSLAEKKVKVQEATVHLHDTSDKARIASLTRVRDQAQAEVNLTKRRLEQMEIKAPLNGVIIYAPNYSQGWVNAKPFKVGDQAWPGGVVAEIPDLATLEMEAKIDEIDRGKIEVNQETRVRVDSFPESTFPGKLSQLSPLTEQSFEWPPTRSFRGYARVEKADSRLRPSMNGSMDIVVNRVPNALSVPAKALFTRNGKALVYIASKTEYRPVEVEVLARNPDEVAVKGLQPGSSVTLTEPEKSERKP
jgi:multidrug efflux pump subunit AcrA (membrane-fusion protein)